MALYPEIIASAKALCDQTGSDQGGTLAEHVAWLGEEYAALVRRLAKIIPDYYTLQTEGTLAATPAIPVGPYVQIRKVQRQIETGRWQLIPPADPNFTGDADRLCWRAIGSNLEILPATTDPATIVRVEYIPPYALPNDATHLSLPSGLEMCLVHLLAKRIRIRLDQQYRVHDEEYVRTWTEITSGLLPTSAQPRAVSDFDADENECW
jgi:hypothetical protein